MKQIYIHYGDDKFNINKFERIQNVPYSNKPFGGLWACREDARYDWKMWCLDNVDGDISLCDINKSFKFTIKDSARWKTIKTYKDFEMLPKVKGKHDFMHTNRSLIDFEALLRQGIDVFELDYYENPESVAKDNVLSTVRAMWSEFYTWDVDCIIVLNPDVIEEF